MTCCVDHETPDSVWPPDLCECDEHLATDLICHLDHGHDWFLTYREQVEMDLATMRAVHAARHARDQEFQT